jgi:Uncharacterized protein conserved in bacteria (DUF2147)
LVPEKQGVLINHPGMKKIIILIISFISVNRLAAQKIDGLWYSSDSTRLYEIKKTTENKYIAVIKSSTREKDSTGYVVIKDLQYNSRRKRYEGVIYAVKDGDATFVKIKFTNTNKIILKLSRMFIFDVSIDWIRA